MTMSMFIRVIESEIEWCVKNDGAVPEEFRKGFVAGLRQAIFLINAAKQRMSFWSGGEPECDPTPPSGENTKGDVWECLKMLVAELDRLPNEHPQWPDSPMRRECINALNLAPSGDNEN